MNIFHGSSRLATLHIKRDHIATAAGHNGIYESYPRKTNPTETDLAGMYMFKQGAHRISPENNDRTRRDFWAKIKDTGIPRGMPLCNYRERVIPRLGRGCNHLGAKNRDILLETYLENTEQTNRNATNKGTTLTQLCFTLCPPTPPAAHPRIKPTPILHEQRTCTANEQNKPKKAPKPIGRLTIQTHCCTPIPPPT